MGHLMTEDRKLVHHHFALISPVDALVGDQASGCYHVCRHAVTDEEKDILGFPHSGKITDKPVGDGLGSVVVGESRRVFASFVKSDFPVSLRSDFYKRRFASIPGE